MRPCSSTTRRSTTPRRIAMAKLPLRIWILIIAVLFAILAINPAPWASGIELRHVPEGSEAANAGLKQGMKLTEINNLPIKTLEDVNAALASIIITQKNYTLTTDQGAFSLTPTEILPFAIENTTIIAASPPLTKGMKLTAIN